MLAFGNDHAGIELKNILMEHCRSKGLDCTDLSPGDDTEYAVNAKRVAAAVKSGEYRLGVIICGTGVGVSVVANKFKGVRAVVCSEPYTAKLSREHNDANILCMGARVVGAELAKMILDTWLSSEFLGERHAQRVKMIKDIEDENFLP